MNGEHRHAITIRAYAQWLLESHHASLPHADFLRRYGNLPEDLPLPLEPLNYEPMLGPDYEGEGSALTESTALRIGLASQECPSDTPDHHSFSPGQATWHRRSMIVLGEPGSGKTTLLRLYLIRRASELRNRMAGRIPLWLSFDGFARFLETEHAPSAPNSLLRFILEQARQFPGLEEVTADALSVGSGILLLFDGLDRVPAPLRDDVRSQLTAFSREHTGPDKGTLIYLTSRLEGYLPIPLPAPAFQAIMLPITQGRNSELARVWHRHLGSLWRRDVDDPFATVRFSNALAQHLLTYPSLGGLFGNPLLRTLLILDAFQGRPLPTRRAEAVDRIQQAIRGLDAPPALRDHRAFREFETAGRWLERNDLGKALECWLQEPPQTGLVRMALARTGDQNPSIAEQGVRSILDHGSAYEPLLRRDLFLAATCLVDEVPVSAAQTHHILNGIWELAVHNHFDLYRRQARELLRNCIGNPIVPMAMEPLLNRMFESEDQELHHILVDGLKHSRYSGASEWLWKLTHHPVEGTRNNALNALAGNRRDFEALKRWLCRGEEPPPPVALDLALALSRNSLEGVNAALACVSPAHGTSAEFYAGVAMQMGYDPASVYLKLLESLDPKVKLRAVHHLLETDHAPEAVEELRRLLDHPELELRQTAARQLLEQNVDVARTAAINEALKSPDEGDRLISAELLFGTEQQRLGELLILFEHLLSSSGDIRIRAAGALLDTPYRSTAIHTLAADLADTHLCFSASCKLRWDTLSPEDEGPLVSLLEAGDEGTRIAAAELLMGQRNGAQAEQALRSLLTSKNPASRLQAAKVLMQWRRDPELLTNLVSFLEQFADSGVGSMEAANLLMGTPEQHHVEAWAIRRAAGPSAYWRSLGQYLTFLPLSSLGRQLLIPLLVSDGSHRAHTVSQILLGQADYTDCLVELERLLRDASAWPPETVRPAHPLHLTAWTYARLWVRRAQDLAGASQVASVHHSTDSRAETGASTAAS